jgi:hypothetical protein
MKRILTLATVVMMTAVCAYSQSEVAKVSTSACTLKTSQAPAVRGIKLGMSVEDLLALFPGSAAEDGIRLAISKADNYPNFGVVRMDIIPSRYSTKERFAGINHYNFVILDGRVAQYEVQYLPAPQGPTWRNIDDFIARIADAFQLPAAKDWTAQAYNPSTKELKCDGFQLWASNVNLNGRLMVATVDAPFKIQEERAAAFEAKARRDFRP